MLYRPWRPSGLYQMTDSPGRTRCVTTSIGCKLDPATGEFEDLGPVTARRRGIRASSVRWTRTRGLRLRFVLYMICGR